VSSHYDIEDRQNNQQSNTEFSLEDRIRRRAYELFEQRGREEGHEDEDWSRAEAEITAQDREEGAEDVESAA
jgi:hypothetical protein